MFNYCIFEILHIYYSYVCKTTESNFYLIGCYINIYLL